MFLFYNYSKTQKKERNCDEQITSISFVNSKRRIEVRLVISSKQKEHLEIHLVAMGHNIRKYQKQKNTDETNQIRFKGKKKRAVTLKIVINTIYSLQSLLIFHNHLNKCRNKEFYDKCCHKE